VERLWAALKSKHGTGRGQRERAAVSSNFNFGLPNFPFYAFKKI